MYEIVSLQNVELQWKKISYEGAAHTAHWGLNFEQKIRFENLKSFNSIKIVDIALSFRYDRLFIKYQKVCKKRIIVTKVFLEL